MMSSDRPQTNVLGKSILVIAAHPDDEVLGCGGTIARHGDAGDQVHILIIAEGATSRSQQRSREAASHELSQLGAAARQAADILGAAGVSLMDFPDNRLDSCDRLDLTKVIEQYVKQYQPHTVYTHHAGDVNIDHRRIHEAVITACRPTPGHCVQRLLSYEIASSTEWQPPGSNAPFMPTWFVDINSQWERKRLALEAYAQEMRPWPHARSLEAVHHLARWRGATVGCEAAEAFMLLRNLEMA